ncbi:NADH-quinone oxidoreductase subunit NuoH [Candidatus Purcelliella pentastirinorum]|uniref:NADH-quinone oxidoreductase subunit H n=1 Tax=Candidatus Purcelliella pentastirinorum TaxID=472834 RepID=A0AAX3N8U5_9ENTR|nr:NADH-quinone oxidoreductase subunit NuoH [Candidatus Purcelliella pentastirinorum]WDI78360.1 NADH-quinone oxidoreductase subunit NuoH [Candidatus Purcelliella pentastirinorum]WDR80613.1 NADH-quinone oxidoreductase subunit NuoH [Candidatus Purcelliella pentastirinorum]
MFLLKLNITEKIHIIKNLTILLIIIISGAFLSFIERRILAILQNRYGPNQVGWEGTLQVLADMIKMLFKEDWIPPFSKKTLFIISPILAFILPIIITSIIPFNENLSIMNIDIGILFFIMITSLSVYPILLAGISSNSKYSLLGSIRSIAQTLSYEIFLSTSIMGVIAKSKTLNILEIVHNQKHLWNIIPQFFGFITFIIASIAICHRHPFDQQESEQELSDGYRIEYSGMKFALFFLGEYINIISMSFMIVSIFLGGWYGLNFLSPIIWIILKTFFCTTIFIVIRASLPRPRFDQIIKFGWMFCLPLTLLNLIITSIIILYK